MPRRSSGFVVPYRGHLRGRVGRPTSRDVPAPTYGGGRPYRAGIRRIEQRMFLVLVPTAAAAPLSACGRTWDDAALAESVALADDRMGALDAAGLLASRDRLLRELGCTSAHLGATRIGAIHRIVATAALLEHEDDRIAPALAGLLAADPGYTLPTALYPEGHPIRARLAQADTLLQDAGTRPLLATLRLEVDGRAASSAPTARPSILQELGPTGAVVETRYVWPDDDLGAWAPIPAPTRKPPGPARVPLLVATAASVVTTGVLLGVAAADKASFRDESIARTDQELIDLRNTTNGLTIGWAVAGAASVGLGIGLGFAW